MRSGLLRSRVALYRDDSAPDAVGQLVKSPVLLGTYWASVKPLAGRELEVARQLRGDVSHLVTMRRVGEIESTNYFIFRGRRLDVSGAIDLDSRRRELAVYCVEASARDS